MTRTLDTVLAEYLVLDAYDRRRRLMGWDMGHGRRTRVIDRLIDEAVELEAFARIGMIAALELESVDLDVAIGGPDALAAAWRRVGAPAMNRAARLAPTVSARRGSSNGPALTLAAWREVALLVGERLELAAPSEGEAERRRYAEPELTDEERAEATRVRRSLERRFLEVSR
jgi:hypothetical protein